MALWKPSSSPAPKPALTPMPPMAPAPEPVRAAEPVQKPRPAVAAVDQTVLGKGISIKGSMSGADSLLIDGEVEGVIEVPGERVTVGPHGQVHAAAESQGPCISAREIIVLGKIVGNVEATDRVEIRANASLTGNISTGRITIEDGAFFRGGIDIRQPKPSAAEPVSAPAQTAGTLL